jgi:hypothetical protein
MAPYRDYFSVGNCYWSRDSGTSNILRIVYHTALKEVQEVAEEKKGEEKGLLQVAVDLLHISGAETVKEMINPLPYLRMKDKGKKT